MNALYYDKITNAVRLGNRFSMGARIHRPERSILSKSTGEVDIVIPITGITKSFPPPGLRIDIDLWALRNLIDDDLIPQMYRIGHRIDNVRL